MKKDHIEELRRNHEEAYRELDSSAVVVAVMDNDDSEQNCVVQSYKAKGYKLVDINNFGVGATHLGKYLVFVRESDNQTEKVSQWQKHLIKTAI